MAVTSSPLRETTRGRPVSTSHAAIEQAAFALFAEHGFAGTTMDAIARSLGVSTRTLFRYYRSKNDIPWGQFALTLQEFRRVLDSVPDDVPIYQAVQHGVLEFNRVPPGAKPEHRDRMRLILTTPELQAHSVLRYAEWRDVIAEYVAKRHECESTDLGPRLAGHVSLSLALTAYEIWLEMDGAEDEDLLALLAATLEELEHYIRA